MVDTLEVVYLIYFTASLNWLTFVLQETEGDADIAEAVRLAVVLLEIVAG